MQYTNCVSGYLSSPDLTRRQCCTFFLHTQVNYVSADTIKVGVRDALHWTARRSRHHPPVNIEPDSGLTYTFALRTKYTSYFNTTFGDIISKY